MTKFHSEAATMGHEVFSYRRPFLSALHYRISPWELRSRHYFFANAEAAAKQLAPFGRHISRCFDNERRELVLSCSAPASWLGRVAAALGLVAGAGPFAKIKARQ